MAFALYSEHTMIFALCRCFGLTNALAEKVMVRSYP